MTTTKSPAPSAARKPADDSWTPVFYSAALYPGIGQWMQHRRNAGLFYGLVFTILALLFTWVMVVYLSQVIPILRDALAGEDISGREIPPLMNLLKPFAAVLFVYVGNIIDVLRGRMLLRR